MHLPPGTVYVLPGLGSHGMLGHPRHRIAIFIPITMATSHAQLVLARRHKPQVACPSGPDGTSCGTSRTVGYNGVL